MRVHAVSCASRLTLVLLPPSAQCSQAYHHIPDLPTLTKTLARRLKVGGRLVVIDISDRADFEQFVGNNAEVRDVVAHKKGFSDQDLRDLFQGTGLLTDIKVEVRTPCDKSSPSLTWPPSGSFPTRRPSAL